MEDVPNYIANYMKERKYRSKYQNLTPEERCDMYIKKRLEWRERNQDRIELYGKQRCDVCDNMYNNIYNHNTTKRHLINAAAVAEGKEPPFKPYAQKINTDVMEKVLMTHKNAMSQQNHTM